MSQATPPLGGVLETSLYVEDLLRSRAFYQDLFDFPLLFQDDRLSALAVPGNQVLLLFLRGASGGPNLVPGGVIPPHGGTGRLHLAFAIAAADLPGWERRLEEAGVPLESRVTAPRGGVSIYFRDPDGHLLELATPGIWPTY